MNTRTRLAAVCAAATLTVGLATPALGADTDNADGQQMMVLTQDQIDQLAAHAQIDVYRDAADDGGTAHQPSPDTTSDGSGGNHLDAATPGKLAAHGSFEGDYGMVQTVPVDGGGQDYFAIDSLGLVQRRTASGAEVWRRDNASWYRDWNVTPARVYQVEPYPARIVMGYNAVSPFTPASSRGFATADFTGDGVADLAFTASVGSNPYRPMTGSLSTGTFVTIVDGATGKTVWSKLYPAVYALNTVGTTLVVADSPYFNSNAPATSKTLLQGLRFQPSNGALSVSDSWTFDAGSYTATGWADLEPVGGGLLAASWNIRKTSAAAVPSGHTMVIDTTDGSVRWTATDRMYSRQLHYDPARDRIFAVEQSDPNEGVQYQLVGYDLGSGARTVLATRVNALPVASTVGVLDGRGAPEYVVSEATLDPNLYLNASSVRAVNGDTGAALWSRTLKRDPANSHDGIVAWGLATAGDRVLVNYRDDVDYNNGENRGGAWYGRIAALAGNNGAVKWEHSGVAASQMWSQPIVNGKDVRVRTVDTLQNVRTYNLGSGKQTALTPLPADSSSAVAVDVNGDGKQDLVVGGASSGVFAYDGPSLVAGSVKRLWTAVVPGQVHQLVRGDVNGDGKDEIVVAADTAAAVIDASTGKVLSTMPGGSQFVHAVAVGDLNGDHNADVAIATDAVRAYRGDTGAPLWEFHAPASAGDVVFSDPSVGDGKVYAEYATHYSLATPDAVTGGVAIDGRSGKQAWKVAPTAPAELGFDGSVYGAPQRAATFASPEIPYADGHAVVYTWVGRVSTTQPPVVFMEIRDGRDGTLLHSAKMGGPTALNGWWTSDEGLHASTVAAIRTFGPGGADAVMNAIPTLEMAGAATNANGERVLVTSVDGGLSLFPWSALHGDGFAMPAANLNALSGREMIVADLDGDGHEEAVSLSLDEYGMDRMSWEFGSGYSVPFTAMRQFVVATIDPA